MGHCVNRSLPEFKALQAETGLNSLLLAAKISVWQESNGLDKFPRSSELNYQKATGETIDGMANTGLARATMRDVRNTLKEFRAKTGIDYIEVEDPKADWSGKFDNGKVYINVSKIKPDTAIHEYMHPIVKQIMQDNPKLYQALVRDLQENYADVLTATRENYSELSGRDLIEEAIVQVMGQQGLKYVGKPKTPWEIISNKVREVLKKIFNNQFGIGKLNFEQLPENFSINDVMQAVAASTRVNVSPQLGTVNYQKADNVIKKSLNRLANNKVSYTKQMISNEALKTPDQYLDPSGRTERYVDDVTGEVLERRVTDSSRKDLVKSKGLEKANIIVQAPNNKIKANGGTAVHATAEYYFNNLILNDTSGLVNKDVATDGLKLPSNYLTNAQKVAIKEYVTAVYEEIKEMQRSIDPKGVVNIIPEALLIDKASSIGGTVDLLVMFSDASISMYDFKTFTPYKEFKSTTSGDLIANPIQDYKLKSWTHQIASYKKILTDVHGHSKFRHTRIIPIRVDYKAKESKNLDDNLLPSIERLDVGPQASKFLEQIPVTVEQTEDKELNTLINRQVLILKNLEEQIKKVPYGKRNSIADRIERTKTSIRRLQVDKDINFIIANARQLIEELEGKDRESGRLAIADPLNEKYLSIEDLLEFKDEVSIYENFSGATKNIVAEELGKDYDKGRAKRKLIEQVQGSMKALEDSIESALMERLQNLANTKNENLEEALSELDTVNIFKRLSQIDNPVFQTFSKILQEKQTEIIFKRKKIQSELQVLRDKIRGAGIKDFSTVFNPKTGNMYSRMTSVFYDDRSAAIKDNDVEWFKTHYKVKDKFKDLEERRKAHEVKKREQIIVLKDEESGEVLRDQAEVDRMVKAAMATWDKYNNYNKINFWKEGNYTVQAELKGSTLEKYESAEYKRIKANPVMKEFYDFVEARNAEFRDILGLSYKQMPSNFLPKIRKDVVERFTHGGFSSLASGLVRDSLEGLKIKESEDGFKVGSKDPRIDKKTIPIYFVNDIRDKGEKNVAAQSEELLRSLLLFSEMAYNYQAMAAIEHEVEALATLLETNKISELQTNEAGEKFMDYSGSWAKKMGVSADMIETFKDFQNYYIYGIKIKNNLTKYEEIKGMSVTKSALALKNFMAKKMLAIPIIPGAAAYAAGRMGVVFEGAKGQYFTKESSKKATRTMATDWMKYNTIVEYFEPNQESMGRLHANKLTLKGTYNIPGKLKSTRSSVRDMLFAPLRKGDERIDAQVTNAMAHEWGVAPDGTIMRMEKLQKLASDTFTPKSIWELSSYNEKTKEFTVEGMSKEGYTMFRNAIRKATSGIKGLMTDEDIKRTDILLGWNLVMQFRNWMPGILHERFGKVKYDRQLDIISEGRFSVTGKQLTNGISVKDIEGIPSLLWTLTKLSKNAVTLGFHVGTFGLPKRFGKGYKVNEKLARREYNKFMEQNPDLNPEVNERGVTYEQYINMMQGQVEAGLIELRLLTAFAALIAFMAGDWDDDGEEDYKKYWGTRVLHKILSRAELELAFSINPLEYQKLMQSSPIPITRVVSDFAKTLDNTYDEITDLMFGENSPQDKSGIFYRSSQWITGVMQIRKIFDMIFEGDEDRL